MTRSIFYNAEKMKYYNAAWDVFYDLGPFTALPNVKNVKECLIFWDYQYRRSKTPLPAERS